MTRRASLDLSLETVAKLALYAIVLIGMIYLGYKIVNLFVQGNEQYTVKKTMQLLDERITFAQKTKQPSVSLIVDLPKNTWIFGYSRGKASSSLPYRYCEIENFGTDSQTIPKCREAKQEDLAVVGNCVYRKDGPPIVDQLNLPVCGKTATKKYFETETAIYAPIHQWRPKECKETDSCFCAYYGQELVSCQSYSFEIMEVKLDVDSPVFAKFHVDERGVVMQ